MLDGIQNSPYRYWWIWYACIANILIQKGCDVSGSDIAESAVISKLEI